MANVFFDKYFVWLFFCYVFDVSFSWLLCNGWWFHCLTFFAKMIPYDSFVWFCAVMFFLYLLRNDVFFSVYCAMIFYFSEILVCLQCGRPLQGVIDKEISNFTFLNKTKFNNFIISKRTVPWRRSSKWRKTGAQGNIRILRSRNTWGQQRECKRKKRRERERELLAL